ncbi:DNA repair protein RecO [Thermomonas haemolytica]|uniref:DNA repair protein RecO n=1 Tax=Thermomonas haemolytica TaxID=141949 RepID=A0A4R3N2S6_9GAMM|nr:DNA repair protein RecO [Thermomonas haemolytica]TCT20979.1 DNA replication and repair protein RecO [Thermomonas haemolytica]TNY29118.1 DNA repair protein RecO [Thermomonas haemolytica]
MRYAAEPAFVLHARPWRETSLLVEVLSADHGRIGLVARGVQGPKRQPLRAALQPLQSIRFDAVQKGELAQLSAAEAVDAAPLLHGDAALAAFYVNELCLRLAPRHVPQPELHAAYAQVRERLRAGEGLAWTLRRFERDLLEALGVGLAFALDAEGGRVDPAARYRLDPEEGPRRLRSERAGERRDTATGRALLALAADTLPEAEDLASLRLPLRAVLLHHLGGRGLKSWDMLGELGRLAAAPASAQA